MYAATLCHNVGELISDAQVEFCQKYFQDVNDNTCEWQILTWCSVLFMYLVAEAGGHLDFKEFEVNEFGVQMNFVVIDEMLSMLRDACIDFTDTPCPFNRAKDYFKALELVYQTSLFRQLVAQIQGALKTALIATPEQYGALRKEYQKRGVLPDEYALDLIQY